MDKKEETKEKVDKKEEKKQEEKKEEKFDPLLGKHSCFRLQIVSHILSLKV